MLIHECEELWDFRARCAASSGSIAMRDKLRKITVGQHFPVEDQLAGSVV